MELYKNLIISWTFSEAANSHLPLGGGQITIADMAAVDSDGMDANTSIGFYLKKAMEIAQSSMAEKVASGKVKEGVYTILLELVTSSQSLYQKG